MDYSQVRATAVRDVESDEAVTVDTRALIIKILARYAGEWTTLRELIQNAADAQATTVKIKWESTPALLPLPADPSERLKHIINHHTVRRLVVSNNGHPFTETDWERLKCIAKGNPDETKIGAFGVGFYSVFADCEEPFVSSGNEALEFYWKKDSLFTRKFNLSQSSSSTSFILDYRNTTIPIPDLLSISRFLATSQTIASLQRIELWIDDFIVLGLEKECSPTVNISIPEDVKSSTEEGIMKLAAVEQMRIQIEATYMNVLGWRPPKPANLNKDETPFGSSKVKQESMKGLSTELNPNSSLEEPLEKGAKDEEVAYEHIANDLTRTSVSILSLRVTSAFIAPCIPESFASEIERATRKCPPKRTTLAIYTAPYEETTASEISSMSGISVKAIDLFSSILPSKKPGGRIFIGFPTAQTTGAGMHISAPSVIPTVEREAIDLNSHWIRGWNTKLLQVAGIVAKLAYANEMSDLKARLKQESDPTCHTPAIPGAVIEKFMPEALHILQTYTFIGSTPNDLIAPIIEQALWKAYELSIMEVYSSRGVLPSREVRIGTEELFIFADEIPYIPLSMKELPFIKKLTDRGLVLNVSEDDVHRRLKAKPLNGEQLKHFITWLGKKVASGKLHHLGKRRLLDVAVAIVSEGGGQDKMIELGTITDYLVDTKISTLPIPPTTLPYGIASSVSVEHLHTLGWGDLRMEPWLRYLIDSAPSEAEDQDLQKSPKFAREVLLILSHNWDRLNQAGKNSIKLALSQLTVIPTQAGMRKPEQSFLPSVKVLEGLPIVQCQGVKLKFLLALGVRETVDLETIFTRLLDLSPNTGKEGNTRWSHLQLIKYLASVKDKIPVDDMRKLRGARFCMAETGAGKSEQGTQTLYKISELFKPEDTLRDLNLPILKWYGPLGNFIENSPEALFVFSLGLRRYPSVWELADIMAGSNPALRNKAIKYFIGNYEINKYSPIGETDRDKAFLPLEGNDALLASPSGCFTNKDASVLGYNILKKDLHRHAYKFGVARDPPLWQCVEKLISQPPSDPNTAKVLFRYLASRNHELSESELVKLKDASFIPVWRSKPLFEGTNNRTAGLMHIPPKNCYVGSSLSYGDIFDFVDFDMLANSFLFRCGSKTTPTTIEIARLICREPAQVLRTVRVQRYLNLLVLLAKNLQILKKDVELFNKMRTSPFLLGVTKPSSYRRKGFVFSIPHGQTIYGLVTATDIVIDDDFIIFKDFEDSLIWSPESKALGPFYVALGCHLLSNSVQKKVLQGPQCRNQTTATQLQKHILERSKIFLDDQKRDSVKCDAKWLEENLRVEVREWVVLHQTLLSQARSKTEKLSAACERVKGNNHILYVAEGFHNSFAQIGQAVCPLLLSHPRKSSYMAFKETLTLGLSELQKTYGINTDRILQEDEREREITKEQNRRELEDAKQQALARNIQTALKSGPKESQGRFITLSFAILNFIRGPLYQILAIHIQNWLYSPGYILMSIWRNHFKTITSVSQDVILKGRPSDFYYVVQGPLGTLNPVLPPDPTTVIPAKLSSTYPYPTNLIPTSLIPTNPIREKGIPRVIVGICGAVLLLLITFREFVIALQSRSDAELSIPLSFSPDIGVPIYEKEGSTSNKKDNGEDVNKQPDSEERARALPEKQSSPETAPSRKSSRSKTPSKPTSVETTPALGTPSSPEIPSSSKTPLTPVTPAAPKPSASHETSSPSEIPDSPESLSSLETSSSRKSPLSPASLTALKIPASNQTSPPFQIPTSPETPPSLKALSSLEKPHSPITTHKKSINAATAEHTSTRGEIEVNERPVSEQALSDAFRELLELSDPEDVAQLDEVSTKASPERRFDSHENNTHGTLMSCSSSPVKATTSEDESLWEDVSTSGDEISGIDGEERTIPHIGQVGDVPEIIVSMPLAETNSTFGSLNSHDENDKPGSTRSSSSNGRSVGIDRANMTDQSLERHEQNDSSEPSSPQRGRAKYSHHYPSRFSSTQTFHGEAREEARSRSPSTHILPSRDWSDHWEEVRSGSPSRDEVADMSQGWMTVSAPMTIFGGEDTNETRYFAELYVSRYLEKLLGKTYEPNKHWTSPLRTRNGHTLYERLFRDTSTFTITEETRGKLSDALINGEYVRSDILQAPVTFHVEVCATKGELEGSFSIGNLQYQKLKRMSFRKRKRSNDVYILARVYRVYENWGIAMYPDPWKMKADGLLPLESQSSYRGSISRSTPAFLAEEFTSATFAADFHEIYKDLEVRPNSIRLLTLRLEDEDDKPLRGTLTCINLEETPPFWAISYVWGPDPKMPSPSTFTTEQGQIPITESLASCLKCLRRKLRREQINPMIWADALCINQEYNVEKSMQVRRMGTLYRKAERVIIWMGESGNEDENSPAIDWIAEIHKPSCGPRSPCYAGDRMENPNPPNKRDPYWAEVNGLLGHSWFTRTWIVQELVLGSNVSMLYGKSEIRWECFMGTLLQCEEALNKKHKYLGEQLILDKARPAKTLHSVREEYKKGSKYDILKLLEMFSYTDSSKARDKLFAIQNMASNVNSEHKLFQPDYDSSDQMVLYKYAQGLVNGKHRLALDLLYRAGSGKACGFCSWIPNFIHRPAGSEYPQTISTWKRRSDGFCAGTKKPPEATARDQKLNRQEAKTQNQEEQNHTVLPNYYPVPVLVIKGYIIDKVRGYFELKLGPTTVMINFGEVLRDILQYASYMPNHPSAADRPDSKEAQMQKLMLQSLIGDARAPQSMSSAWNSAKSPPSPSNWSDMAIEEVLKLGVGQSNKMYKERALEADNLGTQFWQTAAAFTSRIPGAAFATTEREEPGIVPGATKIGDKIFIPDGSKVPFIMRRRPGKPEYYNLIGECYIHNFMEFSLSTVQDRNIRHISII